MTHETNSLTLYLALFLGAFSGGLIAWALLLATPTFLERRRARIKESRIKIEEEHLVLSEELKRLRVAEVALADKVQPPSTIQPAYDLPENEKAIDKERLRIAHELHDDIVQRMAAVRLRMEEFSYHLDKPELLDRLSALSEEMNQIIKSLRFIIYGLPQPQFENTFSILMRDFLVARLNRVAAKTVEFELENEHGEFFLPLPAKRELYNLVQEAVQNSLKHSTGFRLKLSVSWSQMLVIEVMDNGQGYLPQVGAVPGLGFASMQARAEGIGAKVHVIPSTYGVVVKITMLNRFSK